MSIELDTFKLHYQKPLDGGVFVASLEDLFLKETSRVKNTFRVYEGVAKRILAERNAVKEGSADWGFYSWAGLMVSIRLGKDEGFDSLHNYYDMLSFQTKHFRPLDKDLIRKAEPDPEDYAAILRRAWRFDVGEARCTFCAFADYDSEVCKKVVVGTEETYELICAGSPLPTSNGG